MARRQGAGHGQELQRQDWGQDGDKMTCVMLDVKTRASQHSHFLFVFLFCLNMCDPPQYRSDEGQSVSETVISLKIK